MLTSRQNAKANEIDLDSPEFLQKEGTIRISPEEERTQIKALIEEKRPKIGAKYYVITAKWWRLWKEYVSFDSTESTSGVRPDKIDNSELLEDISENMEESQGKSGTHTSSSSSSSSSNIQNNDVNRRILLKKGLAKDADYNLLPEGAWILFFFWYGGGPKIPREAIAVGFQQIPHVELYPLSLRLVGAQNSNYQARSKKPLLFNKNASVKEVRRAVGGKLYLPPHKCTLFLVEGQDKQIPLDLGKTLEDYGIVDGQTLFVKYAADLNLGGGEYGGGYGSSYGSYSSSTSYSYSYVKRETSKEGTPPATGVTGLYNLGNTCFLNSIVQCLSNTNQLSQYLTLDGYSQDLNVTNPLGTKGELVKQFGTLMKQLWSGKYLYVVPSEFKKVLGSFAPQFSGYQQQDSQELLAFLLDLLHEDLNRVKEKSLQSNEESNLNSLSELTLADESWKKHTSRNQSFIVDLFQGQLKSTLICDRCQKTSLTFDPFMYLSLPIPTTSERLVEVVFFPMEGNPIKYGVRVPKLSEVRDLKNALAKMVQRSSKQIMLCDIYTNRCYAIMDWKYLFDIRKSDTIFAYEVLTPIDVPKDSSPTGESMEIESNPTSSTNTTSTTPISSVGSASKPKDEMETGAGNNSEGDSSSSLLDDFPKLSHKNIDSHRNRSSNYNSNTNSNSNSNFNSNTQNGKEKKRVNTGISNIPILQRKVIQIREEYNRTELFGNPLLISFPSTSTTNATVYELVRSKVTHYLLFDKNAEIANTKFAIRIVVPSGRHCGICKPTDQCAGCELPRDTSLSKLNSDDHAIAVDWEIKDIPNVFAEERMNRYIIKDASLKPTAEEEQTHTVTLQDCLQLFTKPEKLTAENKWKCPHCKELSQATKQLDIWRLPETLIIHLKRFQFTSVFRDKLTELVEFPISQLDLKNYVINSSEDNTIYELYAISNHIGGLGSGHYTCYAKNSETNKWFYYNDTSATDIEDSKLISPEAYILFYRRKSPNNKFQFLETLKQQRLKEDQEKAIAEVKPDSTTTTGNGETIVPDTSTKEPVIEKPITHSAQESPSSIASIKQTDRIIEDGDRLPGLEAMDVERRPQEHQYSKRTKRDRQSMEELAHAPGSEREPMEEDDDLQLAIHQSMKKDDPSTQQIILHPQLATSDAPSNAPSDNPRDNQRSYLGDRGSGGYECPYCSQKFNMKDDMEVHMLTECSEAQQFATI